MKTEYVSPEIKIVLLNAENILQTSADKDPYERDPFEPIA